MKINTEITINAPIETIWEVLTDFNSYQSWNPFIRNIRGKAKLNEPLTVTIQPLGKKSMVFKPRIITLNEKSELLWLGHLFIPGIFDGRHSFVLKKISDNQVQFIHSECFSGFLKKPIFKLINQSTQAGFEQMNQALKERCES